MIRFAVAVTLFVTGAGISVRAADLSDSRIAQQPGSASSADTCTPQPQCRVPITILIPGSARSGLSSRGDSPSVTGIERNGTLPSGGDRPAQAPNR